MNTTMTTKTKALRSLALLLLILFGLFGYVGAQSGPSPIRLSNQADPSSMDLEPSLNWGKGNTTGYNETEIIPSRLDIVNSAGTSNQPFFLDLTFDHARNGLLGILRLETTGVASNAPITTGANTTNPFLSDRDGLDNDATGKADNPGEPPLPQGMLLQTKGRFHPLAYVNRLIDDLAGAPGLNVAGSTTRIYDLLNRAGTVAVTIRGPFASDQTGVGKVPTNFPGAPPLDEQNASMAVGYYRIEFTLAQPGDRFILQFGARLSDRASRFSGATLGWGIGGSTQNVPIPVNRIQRPDLDMTKSVDKATAAPGDILTYSLRVRNLVTGQQGGGDAIDTYVVDALPPDVTFVDGGNGADVSDITIAGFAGPPVQINGVVLAGNNLTINLGNIDADGDGSLDDLQTLSDFTISFKAKVNAKLAGLDTSGCKVLTNTAEVRLINTDDAPANNTSSVNTKVCLPDVTITKVCPPSASSGSDITYALNYSNLGGASAQGVAIVDTLPQGVTFKSSSDGTQAVGQTVTFNIGTLAAGASGTRTITATVEALTGTLTNSAAISATTAESNTANNSSQCSSNVIAADVSISKSCPPDPVTSGADITYTLTFSNAGTAPAANVTIEDTLPAGVTFVSASSGGTLAAGKVMFNIGTLAAGATGSRAITVRVTATSGTLTNTATISTTTAEPNSQNNSSQCSDNVGAADVTITKLCPPDPVTSGADITYTLNFSNAGTAPAANVTVEDTLPAGVTFLGASNGGTFAGGKVTFNIGTLAASASGSRTITVKVDAQSGALTNSATISTATTESNSGNNSSQCTSNVVVADVSITKVCPQDPVTSGTDITYTLRFGNAGTGPAANVIIEDTLPAGVTFVGASDGGLFSAGKVTFNIGTLAAGAGGSRTITVKVNAQSGTLTNSATISTATADSNTGNNSSQCTSNVVIADVSITKVCPPNPVTSGADVTYTLNFSNGGTASAANVTVEDTLPAGVTFVGASDGGTFSAGKVTFAIGTLAAGASGSRTITVKINAQSGTLTNSATISTATADSNTSNNSSQCNSNVVIADVTVTKVCPPDLVTTGTAITYTLNFTNEGTAPATNVTVEDTLPAGVTFVGASDGGTFSAGKVTFAIGTLAAGASGSRTVTVTVTATSGTLTNAVFISTTTAESNTQNNYSQCANDVAAADLMEAESVVEIRVKYSILVKNLGTAPADVVTLADVLPTGATFTPGGSVPDGQDGQTLTFNLGTLGPNGQALVTIFATVTLPPGGVLNMTTLQNRATVTTASPQSNTGNDGDTVMLSVEIAKP